MRQRVLLLILSALLLCPLLAQTGEKKDGVVIDKAKKTISIDAKVAPRKVLKDAIYPIEVIACWAHPKGVKAHETVLTIEALPSAVHKGLVELGLKPGKPVMGEADQPPQGPPVAIYLEVPTDDGATKRISIDKTLVDSRTGKTFPKSVEWRFTGSVQKKLDPAREETAYAADLSGTLIVIFPVSNETVFQTNLTMKEEKFMKLETNTKVLPKEGTAVKLVIEAK